tara:strand:- start:1403 stop:2803 length:1401 start_codon:yes stop_codon:yes gene_type:complete
MYEFKYSSIIENDVNTVFDWHKRPMLLQRLTPPWENISIRSTNIPDNSFLLKNGQVSLCQKIAPFLKIPWKVKHKNYKENELFEDEMIYGPFKYWNHKHIFEELPNNRTRLTDLIHYEPFIKIKRIDSYIKNKLTLSFNYRHKITKNDLEHPLYNAKQETIMVAGSTGLIGSHLIPILSSFGFKIIRLRYNEKNKITFKESKEGVIDISWNPYSNKKLIFDELKNQNIKYLINLAGENILGYPSIRKKKAIIHSRVTSTQSLLNIIRNNKINIDCALHASATGIYKENNGSTITESSPKGDGFLARTTIEWEHEQNKFENIVNRNVNMRIGAVLSLKGGMLKNLIIPYKLRIGTKMDCASNYVSSISIEDLCRAIIFIINNKNISGPVNMVSPESTKLNNIFDLLNEQLNPILTISVPKKILSSFGKEIVDEMLFSNHNIIPDVLNKNLFKFKDENFKVSIQGMIF